jgi:transcription antitermination protein NusB
MDKRHLKRIDIMQKLFPLGFERTSASDTSDEELQAIVSRLGEIDKTIETHAPRYPLSKISRVDLSILRLSIYELIYKKDQPEKVIIDEAVRLAKEFGSDKSYSFINGVLGSALKASVA